MLIFVLKMQYWWYNKHTDKETSPHLLYIFKSRKGYFASSYWNYLNTPRLTFISKERLLNIVIFTAN